MGQLWWCKISFRYYSKKKLWWSFN